MSDGRKVADFYAAHLDEAAIEARGLAGFDHADQRATSVLALETGIAQSHATRESSADERNADNLWTRADFARQAPGLDWDAFFAAGGLSRQQSFVVWQPGAVKGAAALVASQPLSAWLEHLRFHVIHAHAAVLPRAFAEEELALHGNDASSERSSRAQRAMAATQRAMGGVLGRLYVERHFPPQQKARVQTIAANVIEAFRQRVEAVTWLSPVRCAPRSPRTVTPRRVFGLQPFAISTRGTLRSTSSRANGCISSRRHGYASGDVADERNDPHGTATIELVLGSSSCSALSSHETSAQTCGSARMWRIANK